MNILNNKLIKPLVFLSFFSFSLSSIANITTTINSIYFLVKDIVGDTYSVSVLLPNKSPHISALKPSQVKLLNNSSIVFYVDENLETFMPKMIKKMPNTKFINIVEETDLKLLDRALVAKKDHHNHDEHNHSDHDEHHDEHEDHDEHNHGNKDTHIWLSPKIAMKITHLIAQTLSKEYPQNAKVYNQNAQKLMQKLTKLHKQTDEKVHTHSHKQVLIFHNAYNYFFNEYHLESFVAKSIKGHNVSVKQMLELQNIIKHKDISCVITDAKYDTKIINKITKNTTIKHKVLNPLGDYKTDDYMSLMSNIADKVKQCL